MYLYQDGFNSKYFEDYTKTLAIDPTTMSSVMYGVNKPYTLYFNSLNAKLYEHYNNVEPKVCESELPSLKYCAFSNLTNGQWLDQAVLSNPLPNQEKVTELGYAHYYEDYVSMWITPEYGFWREFNDNGKLDPSQYTEAMNTTYN